MPHAFLTSLALIFVLVLLFGALDNHRLQLRCRNCGGIGKHAPDCWRNY